MNQQQPIDVLSLQGFISSIIGHKFKVFLGFVIVLTLLCAYTVNRGRDYESTSKLFIRKGRETVTVDPTAAASGQVISVSDTQDREINSIVSILRNRDLMEQVVDKVGPDVILNYHEEGAEEKPESSGKTAVNRFKNFLREKGFLETITEREEAIASLRDSMSIEPGSGSAVIKVAIKAESPKLAQLLNEQIIEAYYSYHVLANKSVGSFDFFEEQATSLNKQLKEASERLADLKIKNNVASLGVKKEVMERQLLSINDLLIRAKADLAASKSKVTELEGQVENNVTRIREQLQVDLFSENANYVAFEAQIEELSSQRELLIENIRSLNGKEFEMIDLERQVDILDVNYRRHKENLEQVRINKELESRHISNVNVVQNPSFVDYPIGPSNKLMFAMALIIAFCFACGVAILSELYWPHQARREMRTRVQAERRQRRMQRSQSSQGTESPVGPDTAPQ